MDTVTKNKRSRIMQAIKSKNTSLERTFIATLKKRISGFKTNDASLCGKPDIVFKKHKMVVFLDSCFWHGCRVHCRMPQSSRNYWCKKIERNRKRDKEVNRWYRKNKWHILRFWEHRLKNNIDACIEKVNVKLKEVL
ncbi:MAG: very short patch repair endonuclease [Candidatus Omnitrophica bacterium]|nr:very short patch repair endonuclease [Candidatus Omnitrophota bacterium]